MTVEQFDPQAPKKSANSNESQTTTLDIPSKMIEEQHNEVVSSNKESERAAKVGFVSLGCPKGTPKDLCTLLI
ncbi:MAG: hypothetical protein OQK22_01830 [Colwellia sp.]|nr:hypothetical protein [Colwellia sp.]